MRKGRNKSRPHNARKRHRDVTQSRSISRFFLKSPRKTFGIVPLEQGKTPFRLGLAMLNLAFRPKKKFSKAITSFLTDYSVVYLGGGWMTVRYFKNGEQGFRFTNKILLSGTSETKSCLGISEIEALRLYKSKRYEGRVSTIWCATQVNHPLIVCDESDGCSAESASADPYSRGGLQDYNDLSDY